MKFETVHKYKNRLGSTSSALFLLIPVIIFILTLGILISFTKQKAQIAGDNEPTVLGKQESALDK